MAYDKNEPKTGLITGISVFTVVLVVLVRYGMLSYFNILHDQEEAVKIATRGIWQVQELRANAAQRLSGGAMPIDQAMAAVAQGQRPAAVSPRASSDTAAMTGWMQMSHPLPTEMPQSEPMIPQPVAVDPATLGDGGAPIGDGGAPVAPGADAAAPAVAPVAAPAAAPTAAPAAAPTAAPAAAPHAAEAHGAEHSAH